MPKYIAFLRAINVGGHTVKMDVLRQLFEELGLSSVETFIASGNVIFDSESVEPKLLEQRIEAHLFESLGYKVETFLRSTVELGKIAEYKPFSEALLAAEGSTLYIGFTGVPPSAASGDKLQTYMTDLDDFQIHACEIYWLCRTKQSDSAFSGGLLEKILGQPATLRNVSTVKKLVAKYKG